MEEPGFWDDPEVSQQVMKELKGLQDSVKEIEKLYSDYEDMMLLIEMSEEKKTARKQRKRLKKNCSSLKRRLKNCVSGHFLQESYDRDNAIVTLHAGRAVQNLVTAPECSTVCIRGGRKRKGTVSKSWIILREMWQE